MPLLAPRGFEAISIEAAAGALIRIGALYRHFESNQGDGISVLQRFKWGRNGAAGRESPVVVRRTRQSQLTMAAREDVSPSYLLDDLPALTSGW
jgi:hypothetical protein